MSSRATAAASPKAQPRCECPALFGATTSLGRSSIQRHPACGRGSAQSSRQSRGMAHAAHPENSGQLALAPIAVARSVDFPVNHTGRSTCPPIGLRQYCPSRAEGSECRAAARRPVDQQLAPLPSSLSRRKTATNDEDNTGRDHVASGQRPCRRPTNRTRAATGDGDHRGDRPLHIRASRWRTQ